MTENDYYVYKLNKKREELKVICRHYKVQHYDADDIIQELYIKLLKLPNIYRYVVDDDLNMSGVFIILRNIIFDYKKKEKKYTQTELYDNMLEEEIVDHFQLILDEIEKMDDIKDWFNKKILTYYYGDYHTIRSLAKDTKLSFATIQPIVHDFKENIKAKIKNGEIEFFKK